MASRNRFGVGLVVAVLTVSLGVQAQAQSRSSKGAISVDDLKQWLGYIASDDLEGRNAFSEGLALAGGYIADHLQAWGVKPGGDHGSYFQRVAVLGVQNKGTARVTVEVNGQSKTFTLGEGIELPKNMGGPQTLTSDQVEFVGYGVSLPEAGIDDFKGHGAKGKFVVLIGAQGPASLDLAKYRRALTSRSRIAIDQEGAAAVIAPDMRISVGRGAAAFGAPASPTAAAAGAPPRPAPPAPVASPMSLGQGVPAEVPDFTTVQRYDLPVAPAITAKDEFFEFLFSASGASYAALKDAAEKRDALPAVSLKGVRITIALEPKYDVVRTQYTRNVVGIIEGTDPALRKTYVGFGAHYDHVGYSQGGVVQGVAGPRRSAPMGRVTPGAIDDRVWNGADDDGSGTVALMALAKSFAQGPRPRRSLLFVWHTGEERGLWGSRYFADYPTVPIESIVAVLNIDMIGRNRDDKAEESDVVYLVGSDRISSELHALSDAANKSVRTPMTLDYSFNDPADAESLYTRSDHYSYAVKGIPVIFYTTGLHPDYHANTDGVDKIEWEKMARITRLIQATAVKVGNLDHAPARDNLGPRAITRAK
jgi:hypothetical protein